MISQIYWELEAGSHYNVVAWLLSVRFVLFIIVFVWCFLLRLIWEFTPWGFGVTCIRCVGFCSTELILLCDGLLIDGLGCCYWLIHGFVWVCFCGVWFTCC